MVPHVLRSPAAGTAFQLLPVGREGCGAVHDMCKAVKRTTSICSTWEAKRRGGTEGESKRGAASERTPLSSATPAPDAAGQQVGVRWALPLVTQPNGGVSVTFLDLFFSLPSVLSPALVVSCGFWSASPSSATYQPRGLQLIARWLDEHGARHLKVREHLLRFQ